MARNYFVLWLFSYFGYFRSFLDQLDKVMVLLVAGESSDPIIPCWGILKIVIGRGNYGKNQSTKITKVQNSFSPLFLPNSSEDLSSCPVTCIVRNFHIG